MKIKTSGLTDTALDWAVAKCEGIQDSEFVRTHMKTQYFVEITDTYGGEANYSWVTRHCVTASSVRGAMWKVSRDSGISWHCVDDYGDTMRYDSKSGATCAFITKWNNELHSQYSRINKI